MEDYKIIIYIALAILYFLFSGKKKKKDVPANKPPVKQYEDIRDKPPAYQPKPILGQPKPEKPSPVSRPQSSSDPYSLEDILKQFGQTLEGKVEQPSQEFKEIKAEAQNVPIGKIIDYDDNIGVEEDSLEDSLETPSTKGTTEIIFGKDEHFSPYALDHEGKNKYAAMLQDPEGIKTAFIAGEIFNRKY